MRVCAASLMSRALDASRALAWSSWSAAMGTKVRVEGGEVPE
uniref:Uncharacterized protein n=1 Tax=Triticum urartu TaxID=4572 RepID=A0A8R7TLL5_TRIUA